MNRWISGFPFFLEVKCLQHLGLLPEVYLVQIGDMGSTVYKKADVSLKIGICLEKTVDLDLGCCSPWKANEFWFMGCNELLFSQSRGRRILFIHENIWLQKLNFAVSCLFKGKASVDEITGYIPIEMYSPKGVSYLWH